MHVAVCIPVFNDWSSIEILLLQMSSVLNSMNHRGTVLLVDDGSTTDPPLEPLEQASGLPVEIAVLRLRRNVGHQRAICIGLCHIYENISCDSVLVMDGDGEDTPEGVRWLLEAFAQSNRERVIFARRMRRHENMIFRGGYLAYKAVHRILVGNGIEVGNFSVIPSSLLDPLVTSDNLWNHYAASVMHSRVPVGRVPINRGERYDGRSSMNPTSLVIHGLSAISVYSDIIGIRLLFGAGILTVLAFAAIGAVIGVRLFTDLAIAGWATYTTGLLAIIAMQAILFGTLFCFLILSQRSDIKTAPILVYKTLVKDITELQDDVPA